MLSMRYHGCLLLAACLLWSSAHAVNGVSDREVLLGQSVPLSGPAAESGRLFVAGAQAYFDRVNADGGVHGRKVRLLVLDDQYEPEKTVSNTLQLVHQDKVFALFGYLGTPTVLAALPLINQAGVPLFAPVSGAKILREPFNPLIFNVRASYARETDYLLRQLHGNGKRRIAAFYQNDAFGNSTIELLRSRVDVHRVELVGAEPVERNSLDVTAAVNKIMATRPDAVLLLATYPTAATIIAGMRAAGYHGGFANYSFVGSKSQVMRLDGLGVGTVITQVVPFPWRSRLPIVYEYQKFSRAAEGGDVSFIGLEGFIAARALTEGLRRAGRRLTREALIQALESIRPSNYGGGGFSLQFSPGNHNGSDFVDLTAIGHDLRFIN